MVRTRCLAASIRSPRTHPVVLVPGLGSSGAYTFDLSPAVSLADYLADRGWDVWTVELRGNGLSDKPRVFQRSRWWTIDDYVTHDLPTLLHYIQGVTKCGSMHVLGHSMGGMIVCGVLGKGGEAVRRMVRSATIVGSGCFLEDSWWALLAPLLGLTRLLWTIPSGAVISACSRIAFTRWAVPALDLLYFWPDNTDPDLARTLLSRNFSDISVGVILQFRSGFRPTGLTSADGSRRFADPEALGGVRQPVLFVVGDRDHMCPPSGCRKTAAMFTSHPANRFICFGPSNGQKHHYGHFDILMGKHVEQEVFPTLHNWFKDHDTRDVQQQSSRL